jgi:hypothetical protein
MQPQLQRADAPPLSRNPFRGLLTIFYTPGDTFVRADARPWLVPLFATVILALALNTMLIQVMGAGTLVRNQLEANTRVAELVGAEGVNRAAQDAETNAGRRFFMYAGAAVGVPLMIALISAITFGLLLATGAITTFPAVLGAVSWSSYAVMAVTFLGSALFLITTRDYTGVDPQGMLLLNASIFFERATTPGWLRAVARSVDIVAFWSMFLQITGLRRLSAQVSVAQATSIVIIVYLLGVGFSAAFAAMFG